MVNKKYKYHYIYKTTNLINQKYYIGMHSTDNLEDDYLGSGKVLRRSIAKYGKENFKKEILEFVNDRKILKEREKEIVNQEEVDNKLCMNLQLGGGGGFSSEEHRLAFTLNHGGLIHSLRMNTDKEYCKRVKENFKKHYKLNSQLGKLSLRNFGFKNKKHTEETKLKQSEAKRGKGLKEANSQFGSYWVTNGIENKKIKREQVIPLGFYKGRI